MMLAPPARPALRGRREGSSRYLRREEVDALAGRAAARTHSPSVCVAWHGAISFTSVTVATPIETGPPIRRPGGTRLVCLAGCGHAARQLADETRGKVTNDPSGSGSSAAYDLRDLAITIRGTAGPVVRAGLEDVELTVANDTMVVHRSGGGQAALYGVLQRIQDLGLEVAEVHQTQGTSK